MGIMSRIYEHLVTKQKLNREKIKNDVLRDELDRKGVEIRMLKKTKDTQENLFRDELEEKLNTINELLEKNSKFKKEIKDLKKELKDKNEMSKVQE